MVVSGFGIALGDSRGCTWIRRCRDAHESGLGPWARRVAPANFLSRGAVRESAQQDLQHGERRRPSRRIAGAKHLHLRPMLAVHDKVFIDSGSH
jgi:hypothetical protein